MNFFSRDHALIEGVDLHYYRGGRGPALLYLPGGGLGAMAHEEILNLLAEHFTVLTLDLPGFGLSSAPPEPWNLEQYAVCINQLIEKINFLPQYMAGVSLGGGVALAMARGNSAVKKLAVESPAGVTGRQSPLMFRYRFYVKKPIMELFFYRQFRKSWEAMKLFFSNRKQKGGQWKTVTKSLQKCLFEELGELSSIQVPTLILWPTEDELFPVRGCGLLCSKLPNENHHTFFGTHNWCVVHPEKFCNYLVNWFKP